MKRYKVRITPSAHADLKEARAWYKKKNPELPKKLTLQVRIVVESLETLPVAHAIRYKNVRVAHVAVFPYAVHYVIEEDAIVILAIYHTAIDPVKWLDRL